MKIIFAGHTPTGGPFVVGSHHLARDLSAQGHKVLHISFPVTPPHLIRLLRSNLYWRVKNATFQPKISKIFQENSFISWIPYAACPATVSISRSFKFNPMLATIPGFRRALRNTGFEESDLLIIDHPSWWGLNNYISSFSTIYRPTDIYSKMFPSHWPVLDYEHKILKDSDGIVATSEPVLRTLQARSSWAKPHMILENGVQADLFSKPLPCPAEFHSVSGRIAIYIGALDERFDWDLIIRLGIELPQLKIYLIGPIGISRKKFQLPENVCAVGPKPYESLPAYLHHACVALLPMNSHPANVGRSPMKIYEYLASGAPVVARHTAELERRNLPGVLLADNSDDFISAVRHVISDNFEKPVKLMSETAEKEDWKSKATIFLNFAKHVKD